MAVRCRPLSSKELANGHCVVVQVDQLRGQVTVHVPKPRSGERSKSFTFDSVFGFEAKQVDLYNETARPIVDFVLEGYNGMANLAALSCISIKFICVCSLDRYKFGSLCICRYHLCLWPDRHWKDVHDGRGTGGTGKARHRSELICTHLWPHCQMQGRSPVCQHHASHIISTALS